MQKDATEDDYVDKSLFSLSSIKVSHLPSHTHTPPPTPSKKEKKEREMFWSSLFDISKQLHVHNCLTSKV
jgi:hypothetical protein